MQRLHEWSYRRPLAYSLGLLAGYILLGFFLVQWSQLSFHQALWPEVKRAALGLAVCYAGAMALEHGVRIFRRNNKVQNGRLQKEET
jgi:hypothetical protein